MSAELRDKMGAPVRVALDETELAYTISVEGGESRGAGTIAGRAYFLPGPVAETERIFHHTVVDEEFGGRGLSTILVAEALADCRVKGLTVVPICPLFVRKLQETGDDYQAEGGRFRNATGADFDIVERSAK